MGKYCSLWTEFLNLCIIQYKTTPPALAGAAVWVGLNIPKDVFKPSSY